MGFWVRPRGSSRGLCQDHTCPWLDWWDHCICGHMLPLMWVKILDMNFLTQEVHVKTFTLLYSTHIITRSFHSRVVPSPLTFSFVNAFWTPTITSMRPFHNVMALHPKSRPLKWMQYLAKIAISRCVDHIYHKSTNIWEQVVLVIARYLSIIGTHVRFLI